MQVQSDTCTFEDLFESQNFCFHENRDDILSVEQEWRFLVFGLFALGYSGFLSIAAYGMLTQ